MTNAGAMQLVGLDRARYFAPTVICVYLSAICLVLIVTSLFLVSLQDAVAVTAAGVFGVLLSGGLGLLFWRAQRRDLQFSTVTTAADAQSNFEAVRCAVQHAGWRIAKISHDYSDGRSPVQYVGQADDEYAAARLKKTDEI